MADQLAIDFTAIRLTPEPFPLPDDHPVNALPTAPWEGPGSWPGFETYCDLLDAATIAECVRVFNAQPGDGGNKIRWDADLREFVTVTGDRFCRGTVEDIVRGILKGGR